MSETRLIGTDSGMGATYFPFLQETQVEECGLVVHYCVQREEGWLTAAGAASIAALPIGGASFCGGSDSRVVCHLVVL